MSIIRTRISILMRNHKLMNFLNVELTLRDIINAAPSAVKQEFGNILRSLIFKTTFYTHLWLS